MKKNISILLIAIFAYTGINFAQPNAINGVWFISEMHEGGQAYPINMHFVLKKEGIINISGTDVGTWTTNESDNTLTITCDYLNFIEGSNTIETLNDSELRLKNTNGEINSLTKISLPKDKELNNNITGEWMFESLETNGKTNAIYKPVNFNKNGVFYIQDMVLGTWNYNQSDKTILLDTRKVKGKHSILKADNQQLVIKGEDGTLSFSKIDREKILKENTESGLFGAWEIENKTNPEGRNFIVFKTPNEFVCVVKNKNRQQKGGGMWMFDKEDMILTMIGFYDVDMPEGESKITKLDDDSLELENSSKTYSLKKVVQDAMEIEHLTFSDKDFYDETGDYLYYDDEQKLPWQDSYDMIRKLESVKQLVYKYSTLIEGVNVFESKILTANVVSNFNEVSLSIDCIFNGYDNYNLPDDTALPTEAYNQYSSPLYPLTEHIFRLVGEEKVTTPAGTFNCTVVEATGSFDENMKLWMIIDNPGIFAKIIKEKTDDTYGGYYHVYELQEIK